MPDKQLTLPGDDFELNQESGGYSLTVDDKLTVIFQGVMFDPEEEQLILTQEIQGDQYLVAYIDYEEFPDLSFEIGEEFNAIPAESVKGVSK